MQSITETFITQDGFELATRIYKPLYEPKGVIIYYHGGGLIFGSPHDLPMEVIEILTQHFYLVEAPYRLAPESKIDTIVSDALYVFDAVSNIYPELPCFTFGRSSGGFLAIQVAHQRNVQGILDFYGFTQVSIPEFSQPVLPFQQQTAKLNDAMIQFMIQPQAIIEGHAQLRYPMYLYTRGHALWHDFVGITKDNVQAFNLDTQALNQLPPVFIAHAKGDIDVPYHESLRIIQHVPHSVCTTIHSDEHDFDRTFNEEIEQIYNEAESFLHQCIKD